MYIQKYEMYQKKFKAYSSLKSEPHNDLYYLTIFLTCFFGSIKKNGVMKFIEELNGLYKNGIIFEMVEINIDHVNNLIYISESYNDYSEQMNNPTLQSLLEQSSTLDLCHANLIHYMTMPKDNFEHLLLQWNQLIDIWIPFALLYQDNNNWYDILPFDTEKSMKQFVIDHTKVI